MPEIREAGAHIVDCKLRAAFSQRGKRGPKRVVVVHLRVLGDLDYDSIGDADEQLAEARVESGRRRHVQRDRDPRRKLVQSLQRRANRRELEFDAQTDLGCLREPDRRRTHRFRPEARQGFERDDRAVVQVEHGLELDVDIVTIKHSSDTRPLEPALLALELLAVDLVGKEPHVANVQRGLRGAAETAERAVERSVPEANGHADVRTDA